MVGESLCLRLPMPEIAPTPVLSVLVGLFHTGIYLLVRGYAGLRLAFSPRSDFHQDGEFARLAYPCLHPLPRAHRVGARGLR